jgi:hypothetical protein
MAVFDALKVGRFNKVYRRVWPIVWKQVETPPATVAEQVAHLCFVGTLIYACRYQVALHVGMSDGFAKSLAVVAISKSGYDKDMEDEIYGVFSIEADTAAKMYVANLYTALLRVLEVAASDEPAIEDHSTAMIADLWSQYVGLRV